MITYESTRQMVDLNDTQASEKHRQTSLIASMSLDMTVHRQPRAAGLHREQANQDTAYEARPRKRQTSGHCAHEPALR